MSNAMEAEDRASRAVERFEQRQLHRAQDQSEDQSLLATISRIASDPNANIEKLTKVMDLYERVKAGRSLAAFNVAISDAKSEIPTIRKNRVVDFTSQKGKTHYRHEDLAEIASTIDPIIAKHGLSYRHELEQSNGKITVTCVLSHRDGHSTRTPMTADYDNSGNKNSIQAIGSSVTYLQRYTLKAALGLAISNDDDGVQASASIEIISEDQVQKLQDMLIATGSDPEKFLAYCKIEKLDEMLAADFPKAVAILKHKAERK